MSGISSSALLFAQAAANQAVANQAADPVVNPGGMEGWVKLLIALAVVIGSFVLGSVVAKGLRMPDYGARSG